MWQIRRNIFSLRSTTKQKTSYISNDAWNLVEERDACRNQGNIEKEKSPNKEIKKKADADKSPFIVNKREQGIN